MSRVLGLNLIQWIAVAAYLFVPIWALAHRLKVIQAVGFFLWSTIGLLFSLVLAMYHMRYIQTSPQILNLISASLHMYASTFIAVMVVLFTQSFKEDPDGHQSNSKPS